MDSKQVWFITGASSGLALHLTNGLLQNGQRVAAISRDRESLQDLIQSLRAGRSREVTGRIREAVGVSQEVAGRIQELAGSIQEDADKAEAASGWPAEIFLPLTVDLCHEESVWEAVQQTIRQFGRIDVVVNYAGYDLPAPVNSLSESKLQQYFEENVFGTFHTLKQVIPYLQQQGAGMILNFSSEAVAAATVGSALYAATKLAIESLIKEQTDGLEALGIQQTFIGPGAMLQPQLVRQETSFKNTCMGAGEKWTLQQRVSRNAWGR